jgi:uncharacterized protein (DUF486 family)
VLLPSDRHRIPITSITDVLLPFETYLLTLPCNRLFRVSYTVAQISLIFDIGDFDLFELHYSHFNQASMNAAGNFVYYISTAVPIQFKLLTMKSEKNILHVRWE